MNISPKVLLATIQLNLIRRPLMHPETVQDCLDLSSVKLLALVENGELPWVWNMGKGTRKDFRILTHSVVEKATGAPINGIGSTRNLKLPEVIDLILPQAAPKLRGILLQRLFHVSHNTIHDLAEIGELKRIPEKLAATGQAATPNFTRDEIVKFLEKRRLA